MNLNFEQNTQSMREQGTEIQQNYPPFRLRLFIDISHHIPNLTLIEQISHQLTFAYQPFQPNLLNRKIMVKIVEKNENLAFVCYDNLNKLDIKSMDKKYSNLLVQLNALVQNKVFAFKVYFDQKEKANVAQSLIHLSSISVFNFNQLTSHLQNILNESLSVFESASNYINTSKNKMIASLKQSLQKMKDEAEQNRMKRVKPTKVCLISKGSMFKVQSKIVNHYRNEIETASPLSRQLYQKFKERKQKLEDCSSETTEKRKQSLQQQKQSQKNFNNETVWRERVEKNTVLKPICMFQQKQICCLAPGNNGEVKKMECIFEEIDTVSSETQLLINNIRQVQNIQGSAKRQKDTLVKKFPTLNNFSLQALQIEQNCLSFFRNQQCPQIAQYFKIVDHFQGKPYEPKTIYSKYYNWDILDFINEDCETRIKIIIDLIEGIGFLIKNQILHRDIKPGNILMENKRKVKLIDFGSACLSLRGAGKNSVLQKSGSRLAFTLAYTLQYHKANVYNLLTIEEYTQHSYYDLYAFGKIVEHFFPSSSEDHPMVLESMKYVQEKCMENNPEDRLAPKEILSFLRKIHKLLSYLSFI